CGTPAHLVVWPRPNARRAELPRYENPNQLLIVGPGTPSLGLAGVSGLFARFRFAASATLLLPLRFTGTAVSFMMNSMGVVSFIELAARVRLTFRYGICLPFFSKTASVT